MKMILIIFFSSAYSIAYKLHSGSIILICKIRVRFILITINLIVLKKIFDQIRYLDVGSFLNTLTKSYLSSRLSWIIINITNCFRNLKLNA